MAGTRKVGKGGAGPAGQATGRSADVASRLLQDQQGDYSHQIRWTPEGT